MSLLRTALLLAVTAGLAARPCASAPPPLDLAIREASVVVAGRVEAPARADGLVPLRVERMLKRPGGPAPDVLAVRLPVDVPAGRALLLFLVEDPASPGGTGLVPLDPDAGIVPLDGDAAAGDLLAAVDLELDPPPDPAERARRTFALLGGGDRLTSWAASVLRRQPDWRRGVGADADARVAALLESTRLGPEARCALVDLLGASWTPACGVTLVELVCRGVPPSLAACAADELEHHRDGSLDATLRDALHRAPDFATADVLRLAGAAGCSDLLDEMRQRTASGNGAVRLAAIDALGRLGTPASAAVLDGLLAHGDPGTRAAARAARTRIGGGAATGP